MTIVLAAIATLSRIVASPSWLALHARIIQTASPDLAWVTSARSQAMVACAMSEQIARAVRATQFASSAFVSATMLPVLKIPTATRILAWRPSALQSVLIFLAVKPMTARVATATQTSIASLLVSRVLAPTTLIAHPRIAIRASALLLLPWHIAPWTAIV